MSAELLQQRYGGNSPEQWLSLFREYRWDLEDELEKMIVAEEWDAEGCYSLS
ncbi:protein yrdB [Pectobacterium carotovorum subsp. carotovorum PCCS1]|nr:protein yrdB [Pectobacterium carotovorum subsp. carotovorum PCCS1]